MIPGIENMFTGEAGEATYLFLVLLIALVSIGRIATLMKGRSPRPVQGVAAGFLLFTAGRGMLLSTGAAENAGLSAIALAAGLAGFYFLMTIAGTGRREDDYRFWRPGIVITSSISGALLALVSIMLQGWQSTDDLPLRFFDYFAVYAPLGIFAGLALKRRKPELRPEPLMLVSALFIAAGTSIASLTCSGLAGQEKYWSQLFALADVAGLFLFLAAYLVEESHRSAARTHVDESAMDAQPYPAIPQRLVSSVRGARTVEINMQITEGQRPNKIFDAVAEAAAEEAGVEFVVIRMFGDSSEGFETKSFVLDGRTRTDAKFDARLTKTHLDHLCGKADVRGDSCVFAAEVLGEDKDFLLPASLEWTGGSIVVTPVRRDGAIIGFFTAGFFRTDPSDSLLDVFRLYSQNLIALDFREQLKKKARDSAKALSFTRDELEAANQLKSNFLSIVSHELRTPLTSVKAYAETLLDNVGTIDRETIKNFLVVMGEENDRVIKLVDNMLNYSSMETGHLKVEKKICSLNNMIRTTVDQMKKEFTERKVNSDVKLPRRDVRIEADPELISQLLGNLISNAVKFTPKMGSVTITLEEEASAARIVVQDTGQGIPEDQLEKIFERFHQVDASDTREFGGSGLGLAICKNIVEWHDGRIWVENVKEAGARFVVILPMKDIIVRQSPSSGQIGSVRFERERYLSLLVEMMSEFLQAKKASIMLLAKDRKTLNVVAAKGLDPEFVQNTKVEVGDRISGKVFLKGESYHVFNIEKDAKVGRVNNSAYYGTNSFISVPLRNGDMTVGVLNVSDHVEGREFTKADSEILEAFSGIISRMLGKLEAYETVSLNFERLKAAMKSILHIREAWGSRNLNNFTLIALAVGRRLDLSEDSMTALRMGMNMYDLGMMKIPRNIRMKKEDLTEAEWKKLQAHTDLGYTLLSPMGLDDRIMKMVRYHHEFFDGSGYPEGLVRDEIPVEARILGVIDAFRALITHGPYRRSFTVDEARNEIIRNSGSKFDPKIVGAFVKVLHELGARDDDHELVLDAVERELEELRKLHETGCESLETREEIR